MKTDLSKYSNKHYKVGRNIVVRALWYFTNVVFFINPLNPFSFLKVFLLRCFGAKVGKAVNIKPMVNIKYPWFLEIGNHVWIGEKVWIDNLANVTIGDNSCISQGAFLLTGNHNYSKTTFDLITKGIIIEDGVWICAKSTVYPNVVCKSHSVLTANSVAASNLEPYSVYSGNPAVKVKDRTIHI